MSDKSPVAPTVSGHPSPDTRPSEEVRHARDDSGSWSRVLRDAEDPLEVYNKNSRLDDTALVLRAFLDNLPKDGQLILLSEIKQHQRDGPKLRQLRNFLVDAVLKPMKASGCATPSTSSISSPTESEDLDDTPEMARALEPSTRSRHKTLKEECLSRDGFRCQVSHNLDSKSVVDRRTTNLGQEQCVPTQCAHILPFSLRSFRRGSQREAYNKATVWWALHRYFPYLHGAIDSASINQPQNAMTLSKHVHDAFGEFQILLDPSPDGANEYVVTRLPQLNKQLVFSFPVGHKVTLMSSDSSVPLPSPAFLDAHARISRILEVSGIGETIDHTLRAIDPDDVDPEGHTPLGDVLARKLLTGI